VTTPRPKLISLTKAAERIGCSRSYVYKLIHHGKLLPHNIGLTGTTLRVSEDDVDRYIESTAMPTRDAS
jgi:excisionase family DNA binding protein